MEQVPNDTVGLIDNSAALSRSQGVVAAVAAPSTVQGTTETNINKVEEMIEANRKIEQLIKEGGPSIADNQEDNNVVAQNIVATGSGSF